MLNALFLNFCVLCTVTFVIGWTLRTLPLPSLWSQIALRALLTVASSFVLIDNAVPLRDGAFLDLRAVPVALATVGGGAAAGVTVALPLVIYAVWQDAGRGAVQALHLGLVVLLCTLAQRRVRGVLDTGLSWWMPFGVFALANAPLVVVTLLMTREPLFTLGSVLLLAAMQGLGMLAAQSIIVIELRAAERENLFRVFAYTDKLTGLGNRRALDEALERPGDITHLLLLDLDHFKAINDTHGHDGGDRVLSAAATLLREVVGAHGRVYRFGGEEFAALLSGVTTAQAGALAQRLREQLAGQIGGRAGIPRLSVTFSAGLAPLEDAATVVGRADALLYRAKQGGRDRTEVERVERLPVALV